MAESIEQFRIYKSSRAAEDHVYELVKKFPANQFYGLGNDLRRSSAAVSHHLMSAHRVFSYHLKLVELENMRREAELTQMYLESARSLGATDNLIDEYIGVMKQSWGLTKWLKQQIYTKQVNAEIAAKDELAAALG